MVMLAMVWPVGDWLGPSLSLGLAGSTRRSLTSITLLTS